jgi:hypothetical protein
MSPEIWPCVASTPKLLHPAKVRGVHSYLHAARLLRAALLTVMSQQARSNRTRLLCLHVLNT